MSDTIKINAVVFDIGGYGIEYDCVDKLIRIGKGKILKILLMV